MPEREIKPAEAVSLSPEDVVAAAIQIGEDEAIQTIKKMLMSTTTMGQEVRIYTAAIQILSKQLSEGKISSGIYNKMLKRIVELDTTVIGEDGDVKKASPMKRGEAKHIIARHGSIVKTVEVGLKRNPEHWMKIIAHFSTEELKKLGRPDIDFCNPKRMCQYLADAVIPYVEPRETAGEWNNDIADILFLIQKILERDDEVDSDTDFLFEVKEILKKENTAAYRKLRMLANREPYDELESFFDQQ